MSVAKYRQVLYSNLEVITLLTYIIVFYGSQGLHLSDSKNDKDVCAANECWFIVLKLLFPSGGI